MVSHPLFHIPKQSSSYISEAAASLLDERLDLHIVPPTQLVSLSSQVSNFVWLELLHFRDVV